MKSSIRNATVIGFFSLPSPSLAEANPNAYYNAMAAAPAGAGSCSHCGMGIIHHVVIRDDQGTTRFIGMDCAMKVGDDSVRRSVRSKLTAEQLAAKEAKRQEEAAAYWEKCRATKLETMARWDGVADLVEGLIGRDLAAAWRSEFESDGRCYNSGHFCANCFESVVNTNQFPAAMASALICGERITSRMAFCIAKCILGRRVKKNAIEFDALCERLMQES